MALSKIFVAPKNGQGGVKKSKKIFFRKNIRKMGKKILGPLGPFLQKIDFLKSGGQRGEYIYHCENALMSNRKVTVRFGT